MTATETLTTASSLYATSGMMRAAIAKWVADKRCPLELGDFLEEHGLHAAAECARWCATMKDRRVYNRDEECGVFPCEWNHVGWGWTRDEEGDMKYAHRVLYANMPPQDPKFTTSRKAILWLLDNWVLSK